MTEFEKKLPTEDSDIAEIMAGLLHSQAKFAKKENRELERGTHAKGVCVRGVFEVFDLAQTVDNDELRTRLARGVFAQPGSYDAVVRFANGASTISRDDKKDVRAVSFSASMPDQTTAGGLVRRDFAMNNATTFPINDVHAFAVLMRLKSAEGVLGRFKAFVTVSPFEFWGVLKTAYRGMRQQRQKIQPYQSTRYWSNTAFQHGPHDVAKYTAQPAHSNTARPIGEGANVLRDEVIRHITSDEPMSHFDIGVQLLDVRRMRYRFRKRPATFWVENASIEWKEEQAPFHTVARLTLVKDSQLTPEECAAQYIDVNEHCAPECKPLGSINRGRWYAEAASRAARHGLPMPASLSLAGRNTTPQHWIGRMTLHSIMRVGGIATLLLVGLVTLFAGATSLYLHSGGKMLPDETVEFVAYPDQGWGAGVEAEGRQTFYYTGQGAGLKEMRYSWFVNLEMPWGKDVWLKDALYRYGFLMDGETSRNPDQLPVGLTKHYDKELNETLLDITCATCHTGQVQVTRNGKIRAMRVDGGQAGHAFTDSDFGNFLPTMIASMTNTLVNPFKFRRFARRVLGESYPRGALTLHGEMRGVLRTLLGVGVTEKRRKLIPTQEGYGRTDALTRISNTVFGEHLASSNYTVGTGPVSYPPLWNIWKFDWVQYSASVSQPMARNIGESMGVGTRYSFTDRYGSPLPLEERFRATALIDNLHTIETTLRRLRPPAWREDLLGPVNAQLAETGRGLFQMHCEGCHGPHIAPEAIKARNSPLKTANDPEWLIPSLCVNDIGTDPEAATNWVRSTVDITRTGLTAPELRGVARKTMEKWNERQSIYLRGEIDVLRGRTDASSVATREGLERELAGLNDAMEETLSQIDPAQLSVGAALSYLGTMIREKLYTDAGKSEAEQAELDGFGILDMPRVLWVYKPRPLAGAWATPPFLHNGSVPTVYDLLSPVQDRPSTFRAGSREYDPEWLGLWDPAPRGPRKAQSDATRPSADYMEKFWLFDTSKPGNSNSGHEFGSGYDANRGDRQVRPGLIGPALTHDERMAIIEHLKVRDDDRDGSKEPKIPHEPVCTPPGR